MYISFQEGKAESSPGNPSFVSHVERKATNTIQGGKSEHPPSAVGGRDTYSAKRWISWREKGRNRKKDVTGSDYQTGRFICFLRREEAR